MAGRALKSGVSAHLYRTPQCTDATLLGKNWSPHPWTSLVDIRVCCMSMTLKLSLVAVITGWRDSGLSNPKLKPQLIFKIINYV